MPVEILVQRLRVLHVAGEGIEAVEAAGGGIVEPGASLQSGERARRAMRFTLGLAAFHREVRAWKPTRAASSNA
jgi:hypothetical protein